MLKKVLIYFSAFSFFFVLSVFLQVKLSKKINKEKAVSKMLNEIEEDFSSAEQFGFSSAPFTAKPVQAQVTTADGRIANLKAFFRKHNSPLYDFADYIVSVSDEYGFDYRLLPAIAMQESTLCRAIPENSHNCWGWGIYGNKVTRFSSYEEAIDTVARGLKKNYLDRGLNTASKIMAVYTPSSSTWARGVNSFLRALE